MGAPEGAEGGERKSWEGRDWRGERWGENIGGDEEVRAVNRAVRRTDGEMESG